MRQKVTDYGIFVRSVSAVARLEAGSRNKVQFLGELKAEYPPEDGWCIVGSEFVGFIQSENAYSFAVLLQRYEDAASA